MSIAPARRAAYRILLDVERGTADLPQAMAKARADLEDGRDQALAAHIAIGTLRHRAALDYLIERVARRSIAALDPEVLTILRLSAYQLVHLNRIPVSAAVNEGVDLVRAARKKSAAGFANAVLRALAGQRDALPLPGRPPDSVEGEDRTRALVDYFSITLSHPRWLVARWLSRHGEAATEAWLRFNDEEAPLTLRANLLKISVDDLAARLAEHGVTTMRTKYSPHGLVVTGGNPIRTPLERDGFFVVQDEASQLVGMALPVKEGDRVLDACAAPGGKTTGIAMAMHDRGLIVASDVRARRVALLEQTVRRSGARSIRLAQADFTRPAPVQPVFDAVLLDAPCSGLGTLRRDPDIKWRRREEDLAVLAAAELQMLQHAAEAVRPGGVLLYATCSSEPDENEDVAARFLDGRADFHAANLERAPASDSEPALPLPVVDAAGHLRTYPPVHGLEAFFAALFVRDTAAGAM
jgi:16S rRNA (cytosine967-C5)-methyltransferase